MKNIEINLKIEGDHILDVAEILKGHGFKGENWPFFRRNSYGHRVESDNQDHYDFSHKKLFVHLGFQKHSSASKLTLVDICSEENYLGWNMIKNCRKKKYNSLISDLLKSAEKYNLNYELRREGVRNVEEDK